MFLEMLEFRVAKQQQKLGKTIYKVLSQICEQIAYVSTKLLYKKSAQTTKKERDKIKASTIFSGFW